VSVGAGEKYTETLLVLSSVSIAADCSIAPAEVKSIVAPKVSEFIKSLLLMMSHLQNLVALQQKNFMTKIEKGKVLFKDKRNFMI
jgi:hypothetical protein